MSTPFRAFAPALIVATLAASPAAADVLAPVLTAGAAEAQRPEPPPTPPHEGTWLFLPRGNPLIAGGLSLAWNGSGQLYNGETEKGLGMMAGWLAYPLAWGLDSLTGGSYVRLFAFTANMGIKAWSVTDAYQQAAPAPSPSSLPPSPAARPKP